MLENIIPKEGKFKAIEWGEPSILGVTVSSEGNDVSKSVTLYKSALEFLHKVIDIKPNTSKEVYKKQPSVWKTLKELQLAEAYDDINPDVKFDLMDDKYVYLCDSNDNIIDIYRSRDEEDKQQLLDKLNKFVVEITTMEHTAKFYQESKDGTIKLVCYDKNDSLPDMTHTPVVILEMNNTKSRYDVYTGILIYDVFTFIPSIGAYMSFDNLSDFINRFDVMEALDYSKTVSDEKYDMYLQYAKNDIEISVREVTGILKKCGYKYVWTPDDDIQDVEGISDNENQDKLVNFFNTFRFKTGESAHEIMLLTELKKIFRYNSLTILDVLGILSKEYITYEGSKITADLISNVVYTLQDRFSDRRQVESISKEVKD